MRAVEKEKGESRHRINMKRIRKGGKEPKENDGIKQAPSHKHTKLDSMKEEMMTVNTPPPTLRGRTQDGRQSAAALTLALRTLWRNAYLIEPKRWDGTTQCADSLAPPFFRGERTQVISRAALHTRFHSHARLVRVSINFHLCVSLQRGIWGARASAHKAPLQEGGVGFPEMRWLMFHPYWRRCGRRWGNGFVVQSYSQNLTRNTLEVSKSPKTAM
ncbi:hypothetical protein C8J57DRAFT_1480308 [Mycena rebaudengoi]|nr:hypothetical protein C8J57DRAFT_1480308 [Mycena rebaudengoi]